MSTEPISPSSETKAKRRQFVASVTLTSQQVGYAMMNGMTKEDLVEKAVAKYCAQQIPTASGALAGTSPCG